MERRKLRRLFLKMQGNYSRTDASLCAIISKNTKKTSARESIEIFREEPSWLNYAQKLLTLKFAQKDERLKETKLHLSSRSPNLKETRRPRESRHDKFQYYLQLSARSFSYEADCVIASCMLATGSRGNKQRRVQRESLKKPA